MRDRQRSQEGSGQMLVQRLMRMRMQRQKQRRRQRNQMKMPSRQDCRNGATCRFGSQRPGTRYWEEIHWLGPATWRIG